MSHAISRFRAPLLAAVAIAGTSWSTQAQAPPPGAAPGSGAAPTAAPFAVGIRVDAGKATGPLKPI
jgi:hypothetical protein